MHVPISRNLIFRASVSRQIGLSSTKRSQAAFSPSHIGSLKWLMLVSCGRGGGTIHQTFPRRTELSQSEVVIRIAKRPVKIEC